MCSSDLCKPQSHKYVTEHIERLGRSHDLETCTVTERVGREQRRIHHRWSDQVPIRNTTDALKVGWVEVTVVGEDGGVIYHNGFITNHALHHKRSQRLLRPGVRVGRSKTKTATRSRRRATILNTTSGTQMPLERNAGDSEHARVPVPNRA